MLGELLTLWTIRVALLLYVGCLHSQLLDTSCRWGAWRRFAWTLACGLVWLHLAFALHFYHAWSLADAWEQTAEQTHQLLGVRFGGGVVFNIVFASLWTIDVAWWWWAPDHRARRPAWLAGLIHGFLIFIAFNGAIVFEQGPTRWIGAVASVSLLGLLLSRRILATTEHPSEPPVPP